MKVEQLHQKCSLEDGCEEPSGLKERKPIIFELSVKGLFVALHTD